MRMSCNGCRVLRKGCSDDCVIRPCLQWIKTPDSQSNATMFLAKFYGRAGLVNLINAGPHHLRPAIFRSLLYEACGRIVNPIYGSVGLLWSGNWSQCQAAVDAVLKGSSHIMRHPSLDNSTLGPTGAGSHHPLHPPNFPDLKTYDIRHVPKTVPQELHRIRTRTRFKRSKVDSKHGQVSSATHHRLGWLYRGYDEPTWRTSKVLQADRSPQEDDNSVFSVDTAEASPASRSQPSRILTFDGESEESDDPVRLELTLGVTEATP